MTAPEPLEQIYVRLPSTLRDAAERRRPGPNRDAILRLAEELEAAGDHRLVDRATKREGLRALGATEDILDDPDPLWPADAGPADGDAAQASSPKIKREPLEQIYVRLPSTLRDAAERRRPGPNRDAILRLAEELEAAGDHRLVDRATKREGLRALGATEDILDDPDPLWPADAGPADGDAAQASSPKIKREPLEPVQVRLPRRLRREAERRRPGPNRDAILRLADEFEANDDATLVSRATLRDGLHAITGGYYPPQGGRDADAAR